MNHPDNNPITSSIEKLRKEFERFVDYAMDQGGKAVSVFGMNSEEAWTPALDLSETDDEILVRLDLPGVDPNEVEIFLTGNMLTITGEKLHPGQLEDEKIHDQERKHGFFSRSVSMSVPVNSEMVTAESQLGVLTIRIAKAERIRPKQISVTMLDP